MRRFLLLCAAIASTSAPSRPAVRLVRAGEDLQAALNAARAGDEIRLEPGATFTGSFVLPVFEGDTFVTLRTDAAEGAPDDANQRITPAAAGTLARLASPSSDPALRLRPGAHHRRLVRID